MGPSRIVYLAPKIIRQIVETTFSDSEIKTMGPKRLVLQMVRAAQASTKKRLQQRRRAPMGFKTLTNNDLRQAMIKKSQAQKLTGANFEQRFWQSLEDYTKIPKKMMTQSRVDVKTKDICYMGLLIMLSVLTSNSHTEGYKE